MTSGKRVLVVEDEWLISVMLVEFLEEFGCKVATSSRLDDALERARALPLDFAVLDINLAGNLSYPVADVLISRNIRFMFATGYGSAGLPERLQDVPVLSKPFRKEELSAAMHLAMQR